MTAPTAGIAPTLSSGETDAPPFPPQLVEELLRSLSRALRAQQLYLPNNPVHHRATEGLRAAFGPLWEETDEIVLQVTESDIRWRGLVVLQESSRSESLPWTFYKDGIRELRIKQGFEAEEAGYFAEIIQRVRKAAPDEDDLLTLLWERDFAFLQYRYVDISPEGVAPITPGEVATGAQLAAPVETLSEDAAAGESEPEPQPGIVRMDEMDSALYFLDDDEVAYLKSALEADQGTDLPRNVLAMVLDIFEVQRDPAVRAEVCAVFEGFALHLLASGGYGAVAYLLREARVAGERAEGLSDELRERLGRLAGTLSDPAVLTQLLQAMDESGAVPEQSDLDELFAELRGGTVGTILGWLNRVQNARLRSSLEAAAARLASAATGDLVKLITDDDEVVAIEAIRRARELKTPAAVPGLGRVIAGAGRGGTPVRLAAAEALGTIASPGALRLLEQALDDEERDVRVIAVRALGERGHRGALARIEAVVLAKGVRDADLTEKVAYFEAFGALAGESAVESLDALLNGRGLFARRATAEVRACAAMALGRIGSERAIAALRRASGDKDVRVRSAINRALRGGTP